MNTTGNYLLGLATVGTLFFTGVFFYNNEPVNSAEIIETASIETFVANISAFDPNELSAEEWQQLGFSEKQTATILKYKNVVGGAFSSKEQLKKCYSISEEKFVELEPFILLPDFEEKKYGYKSSDSKKYGTYQYEPKKYSSKKSLNISGKFNPDHYSEEDFVRMGFSERQAAAILKYKNYLGGSFISKEKFSECFVISEENYRALAPFILLPEKTPENSLKKRKNTKPNAPKIQYSVFDPNSTDLEGWINLGFSEKQAQVIINYRDKRLKGQFKNLEDIKNCFVISEEKFQEMLPFINLDVSKTAETLASSSATNFRNIDLNQITFAQLIEYGFDEKAAGSFLGFRKKLGGFVNSDQILDTYNIDRELMKKLLSEAQLKTEKVQKYSLVDAPESWLKNHPYFKYQADKIVYYRITYPDDKKIMKKLNAKPEAEARMKLYLN